MGASTAVSTKWSQNGGGTQSAVASNKKAVVPSNSLAEKRNRMKILPQHASQKANRLAGSRGIVGTDYSGVPAETDDPHSSTVLELEEQ